MELHDQADPVQFQLPDIETAKYIWRMCVHQVPLIKKYSCHCFHNMPLA